MERSHWVAPGVAPRGRPAHCSSTLRVWQRPRVGAAAEPLLPCALTQRPWPTPSPLTRQSHGSGRGDQPTSISGFRSPRPELFFNLAENGGRGRALERQVRQSCPQDSDQSTSAMPSSLGKGAQHVCGASGVRYSTRLAFQTVNASKVEAMAQPIQKAKALSKE
jgi:hypothetical protein